MSRFSSPTQSPPQTNAEGDARFSALNMKVDRTQLEAGQYPRAINKRTARGISETRPGTLTPVFANAVPFPEILGSGVYSNPNGVEVMLLATPAGVRQIHAGGYPETIAIPAGTTLSGAIEFSQQFNVILLHASDRTLQWDGIDTAGFTAITKLAPLDTSTTLIPNAAWSINFGDRCIFPLSRDTIGVSDIDDYTSYDAILHTYRVNSGTSDAIVGAYPYAQSTLVIAKRKSLDLLTGFVGDLTAAAMEVLSTEIGVAARKSARMVGGDLFFLYDTGVYRLGEVVQSRIEANPVAVSDPIEPLIKRINWAYAENAVAAVHGYYYYLAVPLDDAIWNNAVLVYNTVTKGWESYDTWPPEMRIDNLHVTDFHGVRRLYAVNHGTKSVHLMYEGKHDELKNATHEVSDLFETRAYAQPPTEQFAPYSSGLGTRKDFKNVEIAVETWNPSTTVTELTDGTGDERPLNLAPVTRDRTQYNIFGKLPFVLSNDAEDFNAPGRFDYWASADDDLNGVLLGAAGIDPEQKQSHVLRYATKARGRAISYRIENTQGSCDVVAVKVESAGAQRETRKAA